MRTFVAVEIPVQVKQRLGCLLDRLKAQAPRRSVRWVREAQLHLTLRFVGEIARDQGPELVAAVRHAELRSSCISSSARSLVFRLDTLGSCSQTKSMRS